MVLIPKLPARSRRRRCKAHLVSLAVFWIGGLGLGALVHLSAADVLLPWMRRLPSGAVSIRSVLCGNVLPFLFSALAVFLSAPVLVWPVSFCTGFLYAYVSLGLMHAYGQAGWLVQWLVLFPQWAAMPLLVFFWLRCRDCSPWEMLLLFGMLAGIHWLDIRIISSLRTLLIDF